MRRKVLIYAGCVGICLAAGVVGSIFTFQAIPKWYASLNKPFFSPPNWVFGPVWTILYVMMGMSLGLVWNLKKSVNRTKAIGFFGIQLVLNAFWSIAFFGLRSPLFGLIVIIPLWLGIFQTIRSFGKVSKLAANLLIPYLLWVSFASILNLAVFVLNY